MYFPRKEKSRKSKKLVISESLVQKDTNCYKTAHEDWGKTSYQTDSKECPVLVQIMLYPERNPFLPLDQQITGFYKILIHNGDDNTLSRKFSSEQEAQSCLLHLISFESLSYNYLTTIGFEY